jgi:hypothetical protein
MLVAEHLLVYRHCALVKRSRSRQVALGTRPVGQPIRNFLDAPNASIPAQQATGRKRFLIDHSEQSRPVACDAGFEQIRKPDKSWKAG